MDVSIYQLEVQYQVMYLSVACLIRGQTEGVATIEGAKREKQ